MSKRTQVNRGTVLKTPQQDRFEGIPNQAIEQRHLIQAVLNKLVPPGSVFSYAGSSAPEEYLLCDGSSHLVADYPELFAAIGYAHGGGGANFNVPDLRGRTVAGKDDMGGAPSLRLSPGGSGIAATTLGAAGGAETHVLTESELDNHYHTMPHTHEMKDHQHPIPHDHNMKDHTHAGTFAASTHSHTSGTIAAQFYNYTSGYRWKAAYGMTSWFTTQYRNTYYNKGVGGSVWYDEGVACAGDTGSTPSSTDTVGIPSDNVTNGTNTADSGIPDDNITTGPSDSATQNTGGGIAHQNTQPTMVLNYIIKT